MTCLSVDVAVRDSNGDDGGACDAVHDDLSLVQLAYFNVMNVGHRQVEATLTFAVLAHTFGNTAIISCHSLLLKHLFSLLSNHLGNLILPDVDVGLDSHGEVNPLVDVEEDCEGQPEGTHRHEDCRPAAIEGLSQVQVSQVVALVREKYCEACQK